MSWRVILTQRARRDLRGLDSAVATRITGAINHFAETGYGDVRRLSGQDREWRLRVGQWRVRFTLEHDTGTMRVLRVLPRSQAYSR